MSRARPARILLVEGVPATGKTSILNSLVRRYVESAERTRSLLHLTQAHTYHPLSPDEPVERDRASASADNLAHLGRIVDLVSWMSSSVYCEGRKIFLCTIDTLHITHCFRPGVLSWDEVASFDRRLAGLGCKLLFLRATRETVWERAILGRQDNRFVTHYGKRYGRSPEEIHSYYAREQERMLTLVGQTGMETKILDCERSVAELSQEAFDYWMS
ncbi:MAG TPA: hypothetical protein VJQ56_07235 [Blastocatellia bacterium]|nr:hypothetical protein [Blastocatellia bacterium]